MLRKREREIEAEIREESWTVVRWFAVIGYGSSCKEERRVPASAESERRTERVCKKWWGESPNTNSLIWSTMGRCKDETFGLNDRGLHKSEAWMAVKVLWMTVFLFHFILLYFILWVEEKFQRKEKENNYKDSTKVVEVLRRIDNWGGNNRHAGWQQ